MKAPRLTPVAPGAGPVRRTSVRGSVRRPRWRLLVVLTASVVIAPVISPGVAAGGAPAGGPARAEEPVRAQAHDRVRETPPEFARECPVAGADLATATDLLEEWIRRRRHLRRVPGLAIAVVCGSEPVWARGFGMADAEAGLPAEPSTLFRIASLTKLFTATAVMQLRDEGRLELDDPVARHLPWFRLADPERSERVTVGHLLTHTAGIPVNSAATDFNRMTQPTRERMRELLPSQDFLSGPGETYRYSNLGFAVLGELVATVRGVPFDRVVRERILGPLGMDRSLVHPDSGTVGAVGYGALRPDGTRRRADFIELRSATPAGGMASSALEMARFVALQIDLAGSGVLAPETADEMQRIHFEVADGVGSGLAWAVDRRSGRHEIYHGGELPTQTSHIRVDLTHGLGVVVLTNAMDGEPERWAEEALAMMRLARNAAPASGEEGGRWAHLAGCFRWLDWALRTVPLGDALYLVDPTAESPAASARRLEPVGEHLFRTTGPAPETVRLVVEDGRPVRLERPNFHYPVRPGGCR